MAVHTQSIIWAAAMLLIAAASRFQLIGADTGDVMLMMAIAGWVATSSKAGRGACGRWSFRA